MNGIKSIILMLALVSSNVSAESLCPELYPKGVVMTVKNTIELCNTEFVTVYDASIKANVFSAERIILEKPTYSNSFSFKTDTRLSNGPQLFDYVGSGYDRGHMVASDDAYSVSGVRETYVLSNITPQNLSLNRGKWRVLEDKIRTAIGSTYILTGASYDIQYETIGANRIPVPSRYFKCVWYGLAEPICYKAENKYPTMIETVPYSEVLDKLHLEQ